MPVLRYRMLVLALLYGWCSHLLAGTNIFGPKTYTQTSGKPPIHEVTIDVPLESRCDGKAIYLLSVQNDRVTSARVSFNGALVFTDSDFQSKRTLLEAPISVTDSNQLAIELKGGPQGSSLTIVVRKEIEQPLAPAMSYTLTAKQQTFNESFAADPAGTYLLWIENPAAASRIKSGSVVLNGVEVISEKELTGATNVFRRPVVLDAVNTVRIALKGDAMNSVTVGFRQLLDEGSCGGAEVRIDSPEDATVVNDSEVVVRGTATGPPDVGISINGNPVNVDLGHAGTPADPFSWFGVLSLADGPVVLRAVIRTASGQTNFAQRQISVAADPAAMRLNPSRELEIAPATIGFTVDNLPEEIERVETDLDGDGIYELSGPELPPLSVDYAAPGLRSVTLRVTEQSGIVRIATAWVSIVEFGQMDVLLKQRWDEFRAALARGDVAAAKTLIAGAAARETYGKVLSELPGRLTAIAESMAGILPVYIRPEFAKYLLTRVENGRDVGYYVYFVRDADGLWRIAQF